MAGTGRHAEDYLRAIGVDPATAPPDLVDGLAKPEAEYLGRSPKGGADRFAPVTVIASRYRVEGLLGKGGHG